MSVFESVFESELLGQPTTVMEQYLLHFEDHSKTFIARLVKAADSLRKFSDTPSQLQSTRPNLTWSMSYFHNAIDATLVSTRLLLSGYLVPSGNMARHALESMAFGILLAFPETGAYREWEKGYDIEYKAIQSLIKNAGYCGVIKENVETLKKQAAWFDHFSHPSRPALAAAWNPDDGAGWNVGAIFIERHLPKYRQEMDNRISLAGLLTNAIAGTHARLVDLGIAQSNTGLGPAFRSSGRDSQ